MLASHPFPGPPNLCHMYLFILRYVPTTPRPRGGPCDPKSSKMAPVRGHVCHALPVRPTRAPCRRFISFQMTKKSCRFLLHPSTPQTNTNNTHTQHINTLQSLKEVLLGCITKPHNHCFTFVPLLLLPSQKPPKLRLPPSVKPAT